MIRAARPAASPAPQPQRRHTPVDNDAQPSLPTTDGQPHQCQEQGVDLMWVPLGAGGRVVRLNGKVYEAITARLQRRPRQDLYHAALEVTAADGVYVIELTPVPARNTVARGVVGTGPVASKWLGRSRIFRYELRRWRGGTIPTGPARSVGADGSALKSHRPNECSTSSPPYPWWHRDVTSSTPAKCGTPTPSSLGCSCVPAST